MSLAAVYLLGTRGAAKQASPHCDPRTDDVASQDSLALVETELARGIDGSPFPSALEQTFREQEDRERPKRIGSWLRLWGSAHGIWAFGLAMTPAGWATPIHTYAVIAMVFLALLAFPASLLTRRKWLLAAVGVLTLGTAFLQMKLILLPLWTQSAVTPNTLLGPLATLAISIGAPFPKAWIRRATAGLVLVIACGGFALLPFGRAAIFMGVAMVLRMVSDHVNGEISALRREAFLLRYRSRLLHQQRISQLASLERLAKVDSLTGIANRRAFDTCLMEHLARALPSQPVCVALLDVDYFKALNDTAGHLSGDECLRRIATSLRKAAGAALVARYGGEEFAVLFPLVEGEEMMPRLEAFRQAVLALDIRHLGRDGERVTISIGGTLAVGPENSRVVLDRADHALYRAKANGRNRVEFEPIATHQAPTAQDLRRLHNAALSGAKRLPERTEARQHA